MCKCKEKTEEADFGVAMLACSGGSATGLLTINAAARVQNELGLEKVGILCLSGISARIPGFLNAVKRYKGLLVIDGCSAECASKTLEVAGITPDRQIIIPKDCKISKKTKVVGEKEMNTVTEEIKRKVEDILNGNKK